LAVIWPRARRAALLVWTRLTARTDEHVAPRAPPPTGARHLVSICENFERLKNGKLDIYQAEVLIHTAHQGVVWVYIVLNAIRDPEKNVEKILCTLVDISESKLFSKPKYI